MKIGTLDISN